MRDYNTIIFNDLSFKTTVCRFKLEENFFLKLKKNYTMK